MLSKIILTLGAVLAIGLTWLLVIVWLASVLFSVELEARFVAAVAAFCFSLAVYPAWKLFAASKRSDLA